MGRAAQREVDRLSGIRYAVSEPAPFAHGEQQGAVFVGGFFGTPRLVEAWRHAVLAHPLAYLEHRATFMWQFLARSNLVLPVWDWLDPASGYGHSRYFTPLVALHDALQPTLLFRPGLWLALAVAVTLFAWPARTTPTIASGLVN